MRELFAGGQSTGSVVLRALLKYSTEVGTVTPQLPVSILPSGFTQLCVAPKRLLNGQIGCDASDEFASPQTNVDLRQIERGRRVERPDVRLDQLG